MVLEGDGVLWEEIRYEGRALLNGISALIERPHTDSLAPFHHVRTWQEVTCSEPGRGPSQEGEHAGVLI